MNIRTITGLLGLLTAFFPAMAQYHEHTPGSEICSHSKQKRANVEVMEVHSPNSPKHAFDVIDYNLDLDLFHCYSNPYPRSFTGTEIITFRVDTALNSIQLNADQTSLLVESVGMSATSFFHENNILTIDLDATYQPGDTVMISLEYSHLNVIDNAFYVSNGFVFTDCEPQGARKWFPCYDKPSDKATLTLRTKVPLNVKLGSNGSLADSVVVADSLWFTWVSRDPVATYIMVISSRVNYNLDIVYWTKPGPPYDVIPIRFYYNPGENPSPIKNQITAMADFYYSLFGDHPFEKDGFATVGPQFTWGGMENQTLTSLCPGCWYTSLIAHEFAHQWFGDMITCATWADIWLNEGFATYIEALWTGEVSGEQAYINELNSNAAYYLANNPGWAISNPSWANSPPPNGTLFNYAVTYMKGSCILYMYRYLVGDSLFFNSLYEYANDTVNFRYQSATIGDFTDKMSEVTGQDLSWFFNQWLYEPNHPVYNNSYSFENLGDNLWNVNFFTEQIQTNAPFFKMPLELQVRFSGGTDTIFRVMNDYSGQGYAFLFDKEPIAFTFDPNNQILLKQSATVVSAENHRFTETRLWAPRPNPAGNQIVVPFDLAEQGKVTISVSSLNGTEFLRTALENVPAGHHEQQLDLHSLAPAAYIIKLSTGSGVYTVKLVKE